MEELEARAVVRVPVEEAYAFVADPSGYDGYSEHLRTATVDGDGDPGTVYALRFSWWVLSYTVRARVTDADPPRRIGFEVVRGLDAEGEWIVEPAPGEAPEGGEASSVRFVVRYDPDSTDEGVADLSGLLPLGRVLSRAIPVAEREAERVAERIVEDLEGEPRPVDLRVVTRSGTG